VTRVKDKREKERREDRRGGGQTQRRRNERRGGGGGGGGAKINLNVQLAAKSCPLLPYFHRSNLTSAEQTPYSMTPRFRNTANRSHLGVCLNFSQNFRNSWLGHRVLPTLSVCPTFILTHEESRPNLELASGNRVLDDEKSWSLRADARRRITLYYRGLTWVCGTDGM